MRRPPGNSAVNLDEPDTIPAQLGVTFTYAVAHKYRAATTGAVMSGWVIASIIGALFALVIIVLLVVVSKAVMRTAQNASELMVALEQVQAQTQLLADLEDRSVRASDAAGQAATAVEEIGRRTQVPEPGGGHDGGH